MPEGDLIAIRMRLTGGKQVAAEADAAAKGIERTGVAAEGASAKASSATAKAAKMATGMRSIGKGLTYAVTLPVLGIAYAGIKTAAEFDRSMAQVQVATNLPRSGMASMRDLALEMGAKTIFSANESA